MRNFLTKKSFPNFVFPILFLISTFVFLSIYAINRNETSSESVPAIKTSSTPFPSSPPEFANGTFDQCGDYDFYKIGLQERGTYTTNPEWSKDCRFIVWSASLVGRGYYSEDPEELRKMEQVIASARLAEGIYLYSDRTEKREKISLPNNFGDPKFEGWYDRMSFVISYLDRNKKDNIAREKIRYDVYERKLLFDYPI